MIDAHPNRDEALEQDVTEACERLWAEYRSFAHDRENEAEAFLERLGAQLEELDEAGAGASVGAVGLRRFLAEVAHEESPDTETSPPGV
jgi:hypothetical protein